MVILTFVAFVIHNGSIVVGELNSTIPHIQLSTIKLISTLKSVGAVLWVHTIYKRTVFSIKVHVLTYNSYIGLKILCI
jgi:hypothetical protein